jgi:hypothetical protein
MRNTIDTMTNLTEFNNVSFLAAKNRHSHVTVEEVARRFHCCIETARRTLKTKHRMESGMQFIH